MKVSLRWSLIGGLPFLPAALAGQPSPYTVQQLAPGVHAMTREWQSGNVADANVLLIINQHDVIVVDANIFPASTRETIAEIRKLTPNPVRYVINTHWHSDHHYGNQVYRDSFPGVEFIQHPNTRADIISRDIPALANNLAKEYPAQVERFRTALRTGKTSRGETVTDSMRVAFKRGEGLYQFFIDDMGSTPIVPGTLLVGDSLTLQRGDRAIVIRYLGRGNTAGDLVVHLPNERIVATGDLVVLPTPFSFFSHLGDWPGTLRRLKSLDAATIMPGHGDIQRDWSYVDQLIGLIESTWGQVKQAVASGADLETTLKTVNLDQFRGNFGRNFDYLFRRPAVEAAYKELKP